MATLTEEERTEIAARSSQIAFYQRTAALLQSEQRLFIAHLLESKGLDPSKSYNIDPESGELSEQETPQE